MTCNDINHWWPIMICSSKHVSRSCSPKMCQSVMFIKNVSVDHVHQNMSVEHVSCAYLSKCVRLFFKTVYFYSHLYRLCFIITIYRCDVTTNPCNPNPCTRGTCTAYGSVSYTCKCNNGYVGFNCDIDEGKY